MFSKIEIPVKCEYDYTRDFWIFHSGPVNQYDPKCYDIDWVRTRTVNRDLAKRLDRKFPAGGFNITVNL